MLNIYCWSCGTQIKKNNVLGLGHFDQDIGKYQGKGFITFKCHKCQKVRYQIINRSLLSKQKNYIKNINNSQNNGDLVQENKIDINQVIDFYERLNNIDTVGGFLNKCKDTTKTSTEISDKKLLKPITQPLDVFNLFYELNNSNLKRLMILTLDRDNYPVTWEFLGEGLEKQISYHPKIIFRTPFLLEEKVSVIIAENTREFFENPDSKDLINFKRLVKTGKILGVKVMDYIVIDDENFYSYDDLDLL